MILLLICRKIIKLISYLALVVTLYWVIKETIVIFPVLILTLWHLLIYKAYYVNYAYPLCRYSIYLL